MPAPAPSSPAVPRAVPALALLACAAALGLYARSLCWPVLSQDDFQILAASWTWERAWDNLWVPHNEHAMPLGRLLAHGVVRVAGRPSALPTVAALVGPLGLLAGMGLVYRFARRERGEPFHGLLALTLFGVTCIYQQAIFWFAASFAVLALDTTLLALLAAQRARQDGRSAWLALSVVLAALAPTWFASGVLAGPLCCLYLLTPATRSTARRARSALGALRSVLPLLGTALFLVVSLPRTARAILHLPHYGGRTAAEAFRPLVGLAYTGRAVVDNLLLGQLGVCGVQLPVPLVVVILVGLGWAGWRWFLQAPPEGRPLLVLGAGLVAGNYLLIYSGRAAWDYADLTGPAYCRYHLLPQLGLALLVCGGLPTREPAPGAALTRRQVRLLGGLVAVCFAVQLPRGLCVYFEGHEEQRARWREVEEVDARCRAYHVGADAAREALAPLSLRTWATDVSGWEFLRGSASPRPRSPDEVRALLRP